MRRPNGFARRSARGLAYAIIFSASVASMSAASASAQHGPPINGVLTDKDAYMVLPPEIIAGPVVEQSSLSPLGRNIAVLRKSMRLTLDNIPTAERPNPALPRGEQEIVFWNVGTRRAASLWRLNDPLARVSLSEWMPGTESVFALVDRLIPPDDRHPGTQPTHEWKLLLLGLGIERAIVVPTPELPEGSMQIEVSPVKPLAVLQLTSFLPQPQTAFILIHPNGRVGARIAGPSGTNCSLIWDAEGNPILNVIEHAPAVRIVPYSIDVRTGQTQLLTKAPQGYTPKKIEAPALPFQVVNGRQDLKLADSTKPIQPVWLESRTKSENPRTLLTADGDHVSLLPEAAGAVYKSQDALWFAPLLKVNKEQYLAARNAALRMTLISNAKQLGLAVIMFAQDNDEVYPGPDGIQASLGPYLANSTSLFEGFTYTFAGGSMADVASPSETILGHVAGPDGRAVIYADGHVRWAKN